MSKIGLHAALLLLLSVHAHAANHLVQTTGLHFFPQSLTIHPGDTVTFQSLGGLHNVFADNGAFRCARGCDGDGMGGNGAPSTFAWRATVAFPNAGIFGYFCEPHGAPGQGMFGTIIVQAAEPPREVPGGSWLAGGLLAAVLAAIALRRLRAAR